MRTHPDLTEDVDPALFKAYGVAGPQVDVRGIGASRMGVDGAGAAQYARGQRRPRLNRPLRARDVRHEWHERTLCLGDLGAKTIAAARRNSRRNRYSLLRSPPSTATRMPNTASRPPAASVRFSQWCRSASAVSTMTSATVRMSPVVL